MSDSRDELSLQAALTVLVPLVELLLRDGVTYPRLANALKRIFLDAGARLLQDNAVKVNDSSLSTLTGIHRKDVRQWRSPGQPKPQNKALSRAMAVFTRWTTDTAYLDAKGQPATLARGTGPGTFDALALSVSRDVHPHALLQEMIRLGVVRQNQPDDPTQAPTISPCVDAFVPRPGSAEMLSLMADNVGDHLAAAVSNLLGQQPSMLEQSVFADHLQPQSISALKTLTRDIWSQALHRVVQQATALSDQDQALPDANQRIRIGMYLYHGPDRPS